jgi:membrane-associated phospholipid phosphatase
VTVPGGNADAALVGLLGRRALPVLLAAVLLAVARVLLGLHHPGDVLAGAALGLPVAIVVVRAFRHSRVTAAVAATLPGRTSSAATP